MGILIRNVYNPSNDVHKHCQYLWYMDQGASILL